jgi:hypothetical protein
VFTYWLISRSNSLTFGPSGATQLLAKASST